jgi:hypothetical protein
MARRPTVLEAFEESQHDPLSIPPDVRHTSVEDAIEAIKTWFFENFEDPVHSTPYVSAEGGYMYIWGGPYETRDIIENIFADTASEELIKAAVEEIEQEGDEWVPSSNRRQPPEDEDHDRPSPKELHQEMQQRVRSLVETLSRTPVLPAGIGHNRPPEPLDIEPLNENDRVEVSTALTILKSQSVEPSDHGKAAGLALATFETKREKLGKWFAQQGSVFTAEAVKEAGKQFGKWAPTAFWLWVMDLMFGVSLTPATAFEGKTARGNLGWRWLRVRGRHGP